MDFAFVDSQPVDKINNVHSVLAFLGQTLCFNETSKQIILPEKAQYGLFFILLACERTLQTAVKDLESKSLHA